SFEKWQQNLALNDLLFKDHLSADWHTANKNIAEEFKKHFAENSWNSTRMQVFNNHKNYFPTGSRSLWVMDEPQIGRDFEALGGMYEIQNAYLSGGAINTSVRADISRPQKMGNFMDKGMDEMVVSSLLDLYKTYARDFITANDTKLWWYGGGAGADSDPASNIALFTAKWSLGCIGGMPVYTTFAGSNDWTTTNSLRVVRFDEKTNMPVASFRMKAYRRAQQDMELLSLLEQKKGFNRWHIANLLKNEVNLTMTTISTRPDDPGYSTFSDLDNHNFDQLREKVVATLLSAE
ncbi:MAG: hypothetical protein HRU15_09405, partial [Planctomycetes bacterium]|nr:hypothetical protein [Planctomycetota bacterium]